MRRRLILFLWCATVCAAFAAPWPAFTRIDVADGLSDNRVQHILQLPDGRMAITTLGNINLYDGLQFRYIHRNDSDVYALDSYRGAYHVYVTAGELLWVKDYHRVWCLDLRHERYLKQPGDVFKRMGLHDKVTDLFADSEKGLWLVTPNGLWEAARRRYVHLPPDCGELQDLEVSGTRLYLFFHTGEVAAVDRTDGSLLYREAAYGQEEQANYANMSLVVKGPDGDFYQLRSGLRTALFAFSPRTRAWRKLAEQAGMPFHTLIVPNEETAYISSMNGVFQVDVRTGKTELRQDMRTADSDTVRTDFNSIFKDSQGGIWIGTADQGVLYAHPRRFRFTSTAVTEDAARMRTLPGRTRTFRGQRYNDVFTDSRGWTWAGTPDGLRLFVPGEDRARALYTENGLAGNFVHAITEDGQGAVWVSTSHGISRITAAGSPDSIAFTSYRTEDGTLFGEYRNGDVCLLPDGRIRMGAGGGATVFHPDSTDVPADGFTPLLTGLSVLGTAPASSSDSLAIPYAHSHVFDYWQNSIGFVFSALNYAWPTHTHYRYRLICGGDSAWHTAWPTANGGAVDAKGGLHLTFALLPPGHYRLQVTASTRPDKWDGGLAEVSFVIRAPWWRTRAAYAAYILLALSLAALAVWGYVRRSRQRILRRHKEEILLMRIQNLIERCDYYERMNESASADNEAAESDEPQLSMADSEFLNRAVSLVESHIGMPGYSVEQLSKDLCMERTGLYKRLTALLDKSPSLFIRSIRLKRAADLIQAGGMSLTEVAARVGFSSAGYMSKCFQEEYGCKPSEYAKKAKKST